MWEQADPFEGWEEGDRDALGGNALFKIYTNKSVKLILLIIKPQTSTKPYVPLI